MLKEWLLCAVVFTLSACGGGGGAAQAPQTSSSAINTADKKTVAAKISCSQGDKLQGCWSACESNSQTVYSFDESGNFTSQYSRYADANCAEEVLSRESVEMIGRFSVGSDVMMEDGNGATELFISVVNPDGAEIKTFFSVLSDSYICTNEALQLRAGSSSFSFTVNGGMNGSDIDYNNCLGRKPS